MTCQTFLRLSIAAAIAAVSVSSLACVPALNGQPPDRAMLQDFYASDAFIARVSLNVAPPDRFAGGHVELRVIQWLKGDGPMVLYVTGFKLRDDPRLGHTSCDGDRPRNGDLFIVALDPKLNGAYAKRYDNEKLVNGKPAMRTDWPAP